MEHTVDCHVNNEIQWPQSCKWDEEEENEEKNGRGDPNENAIWCSLSQKGILLECIMESVKQKNNKSLTGAILLHSG